MTQTNVFLLLVSILSVVNCTRVCRYVNDFYYSYEFVDNQTVSIELGAPGSLGYSSIAFSKTPSIQNATTMFLIYTIGLDVNYTHAYAFQNHPFYAIEEKKAQKIDISRRFSLTFDVEFGGLYTMAIPRQMIPNEDFKYVIFTSSHYVTSYEASVPRVNETGFYNFKKHNLVYGTRIENGLELCETLTEQFFGVITLEEMFPEVFYVSICVPLLLFIVCMIFRTEQPLKSRGIVPFVVLFMMQFYYFSSFVNHFLTRESRERFGCIFQQFYKIPCVMVLSTIILLDFSRVVLVLNLNRNKNIIRNISSHTIIRILRIFKILTSDVSVICITIGIFVVVTIINFIAYAVYNFRCGLSNTVQLLWLPYVFLCVIGIFVVLVVDAVLSIQSFIRCKCYDIFFKDDPFYFRVQQTIGVGSIMISASMGFIAIIAPALRLSERKSYLFISYFMMLIFFTAISYVFLFYLVISILGITIVKKLISICPQKRKRIQDQLESESAFTACLKKDEMLELFKKFADSEWSSENYLIHSDILRYKSLPIEQRKEFALNIWDVYLNGTSSRLEVNVNQRECENVKRNIDNDLLEIELFDVILKEVEGNMKDTFGRFRFTKEYQRFSFHKELIKEQINEHEQ
eukprot:gene520-8033_t